MAARSGVLASARADQFPTARFKMEYIAFEGTLEVIVPVTDPSWGLARAPRVGICLEDIDLRRPSAVGWI